MRPRFSIEPAVIDCVVERLAGAAGMDPGALDAGRIHWAIEARCRHLEIATGAAYLARLESASSELDEIIDFLVIQETRFFRDPDVFEHIRQWAPRMLAEFEPPLRILSAPCSTGQEAYSLAAILDCAGLPAGSFTIDSFDISSTALAAARRGVYHENALNDASAELQAACGALRNHHWRMHDALRGAIRFERRNLAVAGALGDAPGYHLILCRNLFIYLHARARAVLARSLAGALLPGGRLVLGTADRVPEVTEFFSPVKPAASFAFTHAPAARPAEIAVAAKPVPVKRAAALAPVSAARPRKTAAPSTAADFYRRAVDYHEHGNDRQAERRCRQALYLAPGYLPALELLETLWHLHPNLRLRRALSARIHRVRKEAEGIPAPVPAREGEGA